MFIDGYTEKRALDDVLKFIAYRVKNPNVNPTNELLDAESRLRDLNSGELLDAVGAALRCGINPGIDRAGSKVEDPFKDKRGRFGDLATRRT
jgi:hypothetical protein